MNLDDDDFGFSSVSEENLPKRTDTKAQQMYEAIIPLLKNLAKDSDTNAYIHWPNREKKIKEFISKLDNIMAG